MKGIRLGWTVLWMMTLAYGDRMAAFTFIPANPVTGVAVVFDASASVCSAEPCTYRWTDDADNSGLGAGVGMSFTFSQPGVKFVHLTVTDALSRTASVEHDVIVGPGQPPSPPSPPPLPPPPSGAGPAVSGFQPSSGGVGSTVTITGAHLMGASTVRFNGMKASYAVRSDSAIQATVPTGATTGPLQVVTAGGTAISANVFTVNSTSAGSGITYYVSNDGSDANSGKLDSSPWKTMAKVESILSNLHPGDSVLFKCGEAWNEQLNLSNVHGVAGNPITIGHYGNNCKLPHQTYMATLPVIYGGSTRQHGIYSTGGISYVVIDGFDVHDTTMGGIEIRTGSPELGIVIQNNLVHQVGAGACSGCGSPHDDGSYNAGLGFRDFSGGNGQDGIQILNNTVWDIGGHNTLGVHYDNSPNLIVSGNLVGPGCLHNCIDTKGIRGLVANNIATCTGASRGTQCSSGDAGFYIENTYAPTASVTYRNNVAHHVALGFQVSGGGSCASRSGGNCAITVKAYNNTVYGVTRYSFLGSGRTMDSFDVRNNIFHGAPFSLSAGTRAYNDCYGGASCSGTGNLSIDPQYVAPDSGNFHLQSGSPVIGKGVNVGLPFTGPAPDLGAFAH